MNAPLGIFYERALVAEVVAEPQLRLRYAPSWLARRAAFPISLSMPLASNYYAAEQVLPRLANLLPESHLTEIGQRLRVSPQDVIGILSAIGWDTAGALSIGKPQAEKGAGAQSTAVEAHIHEAKALVEAMPTGGHDLLNAAARAVMRRASRIRRQAILHA